MEHPAGIEDLWSKEEWYQFGKKKGRQEIIDELIKTLEIESLIEKMVKQGIEDHTTSEYYENANGC